MPTENAAEATAEAIVDAKWRLWKRTVRVAVRVAVLAGVPAMIVGLLLIWSDSAPLLVTVPLILTPFTVVVASGVRFHVARRRRPRAVILWIRRFHRGEKATTEQALLEACVMDWGRLITLADTAVDSDALTGLMRRWLTPRPVYRRLYLILSVVALLVVWLAGMDVETIASLLAVPFCLVWLTRDRTRSATINVRDPHNDVTKALERAQSQKLSQAGSVVLRCPVDGDLWRQVISYLSTRVDAAIVSAPESSAQLHWEIRTLIESGLGARKMIALARAGEPGMRDSLLADMGVIDAPSKIRWWWVGDQRMLRSAGLTIGTAILTARTGKLREAVET
jgi:hypothetical protein